MTDFEKLYQEHKELIDETFRQQHHQLLEKMFNLVHDKIDRQLVNIFYANSRREIEESKYEIEAMLHLHQVLDCALYALTYMTIDNPVRFHIGRTKNFIVDTLYTEEEIARNPHQHQTILNRAGRIADAVESAMLCQVYNPDYFQNEEAVKEIVEQKKATEYDCDYIRQIRYKAKRAQDANEMRRIMGYINRMKND